MSYAYKIVCIDDRFRKAVVVYRGKDAVYRFIKANLREYEYCRKAIKDHFNKNVIITIDDERIFTATNKYWMCGK